MEEYNNLVDIEKIEHKYLEKFYHFLKFVEDEMFKGFQTKEKIKKDWYGLYGLGLSDFSVGAERIVYSLLNGKGIGQPNSAPVGSDLFFEVDDAFIHIDLKTVQIENIGDFSNSIFIGENQNSYKGIILKNTGVSEQYTPSLPTFYNKGTQLEKICLTYFITILYDRTNLDIYVISIDSMPNGELEKYYHSRPLLAGKNPGKARFNIREVNKFELLENEPSRIKVIYFKNDMDINIRKKLKVFDRLYNK